MKIIKKEILINAFLAAIGGFICIGFLSYLNMSIDGSIWLIPPFGASMVLVMAIQESPLAQPKNLILGHVLSALSGVIVYILLGESFYSVGAGVGLAIFVMMIRPLQVDVGSCMSRDRVKKNHKSQNNVAPDPQPHRYIDVANCWIGQ